MIFLITIVVLVAIILYYWISVIIDSKRLGIPGPFPLPVLSNSHLFFGGPTKLIPALRKLEEQYGDITYFYLFANKTLLVRDLKFIEAITTSTEHITKGSTYDFLHPWLGSGLLTSTGQRWKMHRKFLTPAFHFNILQNFLPIFLKNDKILIEKLKSMANGTDINLVPIIALAALDNVSESIMGVPLHSQTDRESEYVKAIGDISEIVAYRSTNAFASVDAIFNLMPKKQEQDKAIGVLHKYSRQVIDARRKELNNLGIKTLNIENEHGIKNKHAFLDLLLLAEMDGKGIDDQDIREEVDTFLFEGHDTTTTGIVFALFCISRNKEVQEKILKEQREIFGDDIERDPSYSELQQMKYLDLVIKETLRLYPSVPMVERLITRDVEIAGVRVPKNTSVLLDILHLHRNPENFEDPLEFRPERFENNLKNPFSWLAFSAGPRNCIGQKFAILELKVALSSIVRHFKILPSKIEPVLILDLVLRSHNGVYIQLKPR